MKRAPGLLKKCKIPNNPDARRRHVQNASRLCWYAWCTYSARRCTSLKIDACFVRVWDQNILNMLKYSRSSARFGRLSYMFRIIRKTCPCNVYPLEPYFYISNLGYAGVYIFFLVFLQIKSVGTRRRGGSNVCLCFEQK